MRRDTTDWNLPATLIGSTPYLLAARFLEPDIMNVLVSGGADPKLAMPNGADALMLAAGMGSSRTASRGIDTIDFGKVEPESRVREGVVAAIRSGGDVKAANPAGDTALHVAASLGYDSVVELARGAWRRDHREEQARDFAAGRSDVRLDRRPGEKRDADRRRFAGIRASDRDGASDDGRAAEETGRDRVSAKSFWSLVLGH